MAAGQKTVAIWGSCVSRDAFAVPSRAEELESRLPLVYYGARSSWISQDSRPWPGSEAAIGTELSGFPRRMVEEDLTKSIVDRIVEQQPDLLLIDLCDERLQLARTGRSWVTVSEYLKRSAGGERAVSAADELSSATQPRRPKLFAAAARRIGRRLVRELPNTTFVLNEAPYVTEIAGGGRLPEPQAGWARELDAAQRPMLRAVAEELAPRLVRAVPPPEVRLIDPDHKWGLASYHYAEDYYHWLIDVLLSIGQPDAGVAGGTDAGVAGSVLVHARRSRTRGLSALLRR